MADPAFAYTITDHYWMVGDDEANVFSSARGIFVPVTDDAYVAWSANRSATRISSMDDVAGLLRTANIAPYLTVSLRQARLALAAAGLLDQVEAAVDAAGGATKISWEYATEIYRGDPLIAALQPALSLSDAQVDALFAAADDI